MESPRFKLNQEDLTKIGKGGLIAVSSALIVYLSEIYTQIDFGEITPIAVAVLSVLINSIRKFISKSK